MIDYRKTPYFDIITYDGTKLKVIYYAEPHHPATADEPECGGDIEISSIMRGKVNMFYSLSQEQRDEILQTLVKLNEEKRKEACLS